MTKDTEILKVREKYNQLISAHGTRLVFQWISGHAYIAGNEKADILAKKGAQQQQPRKPVTYTAARQIINHNYRENWMNMWAMGQTGRVVYKYMNSLKANDNIRTLSIKEQVTIFRLGTQHAPLIYHLNRINPQHPPMCPLCNDQFETIDHLLLHCPNLDDQHPTSQHPLLNNRPTQEHFKVKIIFMVKLLFYSN
ncbi:Gag-Pol polyprotein [Elysia marginata]|uniref:Gag-Pol polyprotein n=1 Tax=Elysia marginata TaxID=1093978 RepID=A0AAV4ECZ8_9GAST|nr:Gag-Pol polyprotein [Elysia marginata]